MSRPLSDKVLELHVKINDGITSRFRFDRVSGIGFMPFAESPQYGEEYFQKYVVMGRSSFGTALNSLRVGLVSKYLPNHEPLVDIGVGDGAFIRARGGGSTRGYDINPASIRMLIESGAWCDVLSLDKVHSVSFWDSLEHIENFADIVRKAASYCFVSIPIFRDQQHISESKHYRPTEHCWYFARHGLISRFWDLGFVCLEMNDMETALGREDIGTFVFLRR